MERLTELKVGLQLKADVLEAWCRAAVGTNLAHYEAGNLNDVRSGRWISSNNVYGKSQPQPITEIMYDWFRIKNDGSGSLLFKSGGFIEFYNKFYNLDTQPMKTRMEDWHNTVIYVNGMREGREIQEQLRLLGFDTKNQAETDTIYVRTNLGGPGTSKGSSKREWVGNLDNPTELTYTEAMELFKKLVVAPAKSVRPKIDFRNLSDVYFKVPDEQTQRRLLDKLFELGYLHGGVNSFEPTILYPIWEVRVDKAIGGRQTVSDTKYILMDYNLLLNAQLTNTNNTPLNTKTDGNKIIVCKPVETITRGQRPEGTSISGKTRPTTIRVGHLSHRAINS